MKASPAPPFLRPAALALALVFLFTPARPGLAQTNRAARETPVVKAVRRASPAVVNIRTSQVDQSRPFNRFGGDDFFEKFFQDFFEPHGRQQYTHTSLGSGVIIDGAKKLVLTNEHVVQRASEIKVSLGDEQEFDAQLVGSDPDSDLAVLQIKTDKKLPDLSMGDSSDLMIGETVIAIGNPFGLSHTVTTGVISAINRSVKASDRLYRGFIQTDASINPGNSGGPLLNINGDLIGINTAIYYQAEGIGFAIPINKAQRIVRDLISYGQVQAVWLGLNLQPVDARLAQYFEVPTEGGVIITELDAQGPSVRSGLSKGDVIVKLDDNRITSLDDYEDLIKGYTGQAKVKLTVFRKGRPLEFTVTTQTYPLSKAKELSWERYGLEIAPKSDLKGRVLIAKIRRGSSSAKLGLRPGDYILRINEVETDSLDTYLKAMVRYRLRQGLSTVVQRGRNAYYITLTP